ncbi:MAG TPA: DUF302 domain-containing protein [Propionibacteriaceae bacterium]|jgi:uncharacterized protein (DUF302 family)|nr:DUF302 domain-containing protein [Propionibacteriaceae bacterium]
MNQADRTYTISTRLSLGYDQAVDAARTALGEQGFGVLTEIDLAATMKAKLGKDIARQVILGACRPPLAYQALQADPSVAVLLPCNVVIREVDPSTTVIEGFDPETMLSFFTNPAIAQVAADAKQRLHAAIESLYAAHGGPRLDVRQES